MTELEFINKLINQTIDKIKLYRGNIKYFSENNYGEKLTNLQKENLKDSEKTLDILLQIETKLEAWEVAKEELQIVFKGKNHYGEPLRRYELNVIGQNKIDTLNKALEVEDDK